MLLDHDTLSIHATHHVLLETPPSHYKTKQYKNSQYRVLIQEIHAQCHKIQYTVLIRVIRAFSGRWDDIAGNIYYLCASSDPKLLLLQRTLEFWLILGEISVDNLISTFGWCKSKFYNQYYWTCSKYTFPVEARCFVLPFLNLVLFMHWWSSEENQKIILQPNNDTKKILMQGHTW